MNHITKTFLKMYNHGLALISTFFVIAVLITILLKGQFNAVELNKTWLIIEILIFASALTSQVFFILKRWL